MNPKMRVVPGGIDDDADFDKRKKSPSPSYGDDGGSDDGDAITALCREFLIAYSKGHIFWRLFWWGFVLVLASLVDFGTMYHLLSSRFTDAFGNTTTSSLIIGFASAMTIMGFWLISFVLDTSKIAGGVLYLLLVFFVVFTLWPTEASTMVSTWESIQGSTLGSFDSGATASTVPLWFVAIGIFLLAIVYTMPGLMMMFAKTRIVYFLKLRDMRRQALEIIALGDGIEQEENGVAALKKTTAGLTESADVHQAAQTIMAKAIDTYSDVLGQKMRTAEGRLNSKETISPRERRELKSIADRCEILINNAATLKP